MKFLETFISDVFQNFQPILRKSSLKTPGGRFLNHSTVLEKFSFSEILKTYFSQTVFVSNLFQEIFKTLYY